MGTLWTPYKQEEIAEVLNQSFHYCGQGSTSRAYVSEDGRFVIKTFLGKNLESQRFKHIPWLSDLANKRKELKVKYNRSFGPINAYQYIPHESGLIFYQLVYPRDLFHRSLQLQEKDGSKTLLDLDREEYVIQRKAVIVSEYLLDHLAKGDSEKVKSGITKLFQLTQTLYDQGIKLVVLQFLDNFGFIGNEPIRIDVEHLRYDPKWKVAGRRHLKKQVADFRGWMVEHAPPDIVEHFDFESKRFFGDL